MQVIKFQHTISEQRLKQKIYRKIGDLGYINFGIDDSVILYLNGKEIVKHNLPEGEIGYDKYLSDLTGSSVADEGKYETFILDAADLAHLVE